MDSLEQNLATILEQQDQEKMQLQQKIARLVKPKKKPAKKKRSLADVKIKA